MSERYSWEMQFNNVSLHRHNFKQYRILKNVCLSPGIEPRTTCLTHKHSTTKTTKHLNSVVTLQSHSLRSNRIFLFSKILFIRGIFFYSANLSFHNSFSDFILYLLIRCLLIILVAINRLVQQIIWLLKMKSIELCLLTVMSLAENKVSNCL